MVDFYPQFLIGTCQLSKTFAGFPIALVCLNCFSCSNVFFKSLFKHYLQNQDYNQNLYLRKKVKIEYLGDLFKCLAEFSNGFCLLFTQQKTRLHIPDVHQTSQTRNEGLVISI